MQTRGRGDLADRLTRATRGHLDLSALADAVYAAVEVDVPFAFGCFATTDPTTGLITWASKTRSLGTGDEEWAALEYGPPDVNSVAEIARRTPPVGVLSLDTGGRPGTCRRMAEFLGPRFGFTDELRIVFRSRAVSWGVLALYRGDGEPPFTAGDAEQLAAVGELVAEAVQRSLFTLDPTPTVLAGGAPAVLVIDGDDRLTHLTPAARSAVEELGGWEHGSLPASLLAVAASARTRPDLAATRAQGRSGSWLSLRAAPLDGAPGSHDVVVTVEPAPRDQLSRLALAAKGLTAREEDVALLVLRGASTRAIAGALHLSPHTVQDHLKAIFTKLSVSSRREMVARLVLG